MPYDNSAQEPVENTPAPAKLTLPDGQVIEMPTTLNPAQIEALAYVACMFIEPLKAAAFGQTLGGFMRRAALELVQQELAARELARRGSGEEPPVATPEG
jgi:hypothetical protein